MTKAFKAGLLSGLVFPGSGQIYLGKHRGWLFVLLTVVLFFYVVVHVTILAYAALSGLTETDTTPDLFHIDSAVRSSFDWAANAGLAAIVLLWLVGIVDAVRAGLAIDRKPPPTPGTAD